MSAIEAGVLTVVIMAVVAIVAIFLNQKIGFIFKGPGASLKLTGTKKLPVAEKERSTRLSKSASTGRSKPIMPPAPPAPSLQPSHPLAGFPWRRLKIAIPVLLMLVLITTPLWWWHRHSEAWKLELSHHISEAWVLVKQGPKEPVHVVQSGRTLQELTRLLDSYADILGRDPHRVIEVWVVDHYWQYWTTDTFSDYTRANRRFVDSGGKIHRLFILAEDDLKNPQLTPVLRNQCEKIGADVWRSEAAAIRNKAEYQITANAFQQMPYTETGFQSFDVLQLEDLTYYSSDFSPDYRVVGASTWFYGQTLDLKPLFNRSIAQRVDCSAWKTSVAAETVQHP